MRKLTNEKFIKKANIVHNYKYDYSCLIYKNKRSKINIKCPIHGIFSQNASSHLQGAGCKQCGINQRAALIRPDKNKFIEQAKQLYGEKYNYSEVKYVNNKTKVIIKCHIHGAFKQNPRVHLKINNKINEKCPTCFIIKKAEINKQKQKKKQNKMQNKCVSKKILTKEEFINRSNIIHHNKYDYNLVNYKNYSTPVKIKCPNHGLFTQKPENHLDGCGCQICGGTIKDTKESFIEKAKIKHGNKFDYSNLIYKNAHENIEIYCKKHKLFFNTKAYAHTKGNIGCNLCKKENKEININKKRIVNKNEFINEAKKIHKNKYKYDEVNYINNSTKVKILCPTHGCFFQTPNSHKSLKRGCPNCIKKNESIVLNVLAELKITNKQQFKIIANKRKYFIDFFIETLNLAIEYNGAQHYEPVRFGNITQEQAEKNFEKQKLRDQQLRNYCKNNNIKLMEIDGRKYQGNKLREFLTNYFSKLK